MQIAKSTDLKKVFAEIDRIARSSPLGCFALVTPEQLAVILGCSLRSVAKLREAVKLPPSVRLGSLVRWQLFRIHHWLRQKSRISRSWVETPPPRSLPASFLLSAEHFAEVLGCSVRLVERLRKQGRLPPPIRDGNALRWRVDVVREWIRRDCRG
jgi:predicted DNA-binding transcriptional regulator AlpA